MIAIFFTLFYAFNTTWHYLALTLLNDKEILMNALLKEYSPNSPDDIYVLKIKNGISHTMCEM